MAGQYVLMHVWASWCAPCRKSLPDVRATAERLANEPVTFIGLNIDENKAAGEALVKLGRYDWAQNFLGADSALARQLAISSVPAYYLIGPRGKLAAASVEWLDVKQALEDALAR